MIKSKNFGLERALHDIHPIYPKIPNRLLEETETVSIDVIVQDVADQSLSV
jgi:hypothetical protein